jgi:hypothetical protein
MSQPCSVPPKTFESRTAIIRLGNTAGV